MRLVVLIVGYLRRHWAGQHSLVWTCSVNVFALGVALVVLLKVIVPLVVDNQFVAARYLVPALFLFIPLVAVWQIVGLARSCRSLSSATDRWIILSIAICYCCVVLVSLFDLSHFSLDPAQRYTVTDPRPMTDVRLLNVMPITTIAISGTLEFGLTRQVKALLDTNPRINRIVLDSAGGVISEARGVATLIEKRTLATVVTGVCYSACTLIFISGSPRTINSDAALGFHQYAMATEYPSPWINSARQQATDRAFLARRGVAADFISRAYLQPHSGLWIPTHAQLLEGGVVHTIIEQK